MSRIVLGVCGSVAAYRAADLTRDLMRAGHEVRVCLTDAAQNFVTPLLFETLTGKPCLIEAFDEPERGRMAHLDWAREADLVVIAPASANTINRIAGGEGDDMLTTLALAYTGRMVVAPAMNPAMLSNPATQASLAKLAERGAIIVEPIEGDVVSGETGHGKLAKNETILEVCDAVLSINSSLAGKKVLITSGPTHEPIDDVRFIGNRSSGKMGFALARAAQMMGADVTLVTGPTSQVPPANIRVVRVTTAEQMRSAVMAECTDARLVIGAAAVADFRPATKVNGKIRRSEGGLTLDLVPNPDIIAEAAKLATQALVVAFAAEPSEDTTVAREKMAKKGVTAIAYNNVSRRDIGFESDQNELTLFWSDGSQDESGLRSKLSCGIWLLEHLSQKLS